MKTLIIAEAGVNHNGCEKLAFQLVDAAINAGVDIVKFQTFKSELLATKEAKQADYQVTNTQEKQSQQSMLKALELSFDSHMRIKDYCSEKGINYLSTAFDFESLTFLVEVMKLATLKIPSGEITNAPFVLAHALSGCELIISTGMANINEIEFALSIIAFGFIQLEQPDNKQVPCEQAFKAAYQSDIGQRLLKEKVKVLHCTTEYPAPLHDVNLAAMDYMADYFSLPIGYSDHTQGINVSLAAVARGACIIEKHFTLDQHMKGPDHKASLEPKELCALVKGIREIEVAIGQPIKKAMESEMKNISIARKSIFAKKNIQQGQIITAGDITIMRPGNSLSAIHYFNVIDSKAIQNFSAGDAIKLS